VPHHQSQNFIGFVEAAELACVLVLFTVVWDPLPSLGNKIPLFHGFFWAPLSEVSSNYVVLVEQRARS
jgi:hypothetical protein